MDEAVGGLALRVWTSPAFPIGGFAYSHGLEWAVEVGDVADAATLRAWLGVLLTHGSARIDAILLAAAWRAARDSDAAALDHANALAVALAPSRERHLETTSQGNAFVATARAAWDCPALALLPDEDIAHPIALGTLAAGHGQPLAETIEAYALGFVAALVSAAVRLGAIGQTDAQRVQSALLPDVAALARATQASSLDAIGACALRCDIGSMRHETQYSRLFRS